MQVRLCRAKNTGEIYAMKKLKKSEMLSRGQVRGNNLSWENKNMTCQLMHLSTYNLSNMLINFDSIYFRLSMFGPRGICLWR